LNLKANIDGPTFTGTVSGISKAMVGLTNVDDTSDANKPVSTQQQNALNLKSNIADPTFTGIPSAPTAAAGTSTTQIATTAFVTNGLNLKANIADPTFTGTVSGISKAMVDLSNVDNTSDANKPVSTQQQNALNLKSNIADPSFTGIPVAPTAAAGTSTTQIATTSFVTTGLNLKANIDGPTFTGTVSGITKAMVDLSNVDNTSDANKPVSTLTQNALNLKANLAGPTFTGTVSAASISTSSTITSTGGFIGTSYQPSVGTTAITFGNNITTGNIDIGAAQTTGNLNLGIGTRSATGNIFIGTGTSATNTINIGRGNAISIVNSTAPTLTINCPIILSTTSGEIQSAGTNSLGYFYTKITTTVTSIATGTSSQSNALALAGSGVFIINFTCIMNVGTSISTTVRITGVTLTSSTSNDENDTILGSCYKDDNTITLQSGKYVRSGSIIVRQTSNQSYYALYKTNFSSGTISSMNFILEGVKIA
jgi:hypothetical protein